MIPPAPLQSAAAAVLARHGCVLVPPSAFVPWVAACPACSAAVSSFFAPAPVGSGAWVFCAVCGACLFVPAARWRPAPGPAGQLQLF